MLAPLIASVAIGLWSASPSTAAQRHRGESAKAFIDEVNAKLKVELSKSATADWIKNTYITDDTEHNAAWVNAEVMDYFSSAIRRSSQFKGAGSDPSTARALQLLRVSLTTPNVFAPSDPKKQQELAQIAATLEGMYGKGKACGPDGHCKDLLELEDTLANSRNYDELLEAWRGWHQVGRPMRPLFSRMVELGNEGAKELGFADAAQEWKSGYDLPPAEFEEMTERLWAQVKPLYDELHCYVRGKLAQAYGEDKVPAGKPIPAHLLGNMWAQEWNNLYPLVEPYPGRTPLDVTSALVRQGYDALRMVRLGEGFFTSLGLDKLPDTFWSRSMFVKPKDREVVCHASAWDLAYDDDLRLKMCVRIKEEDLVTIHHELGHLYYFHAYHTLPVLFQAGANDGFHEAIGDALTLSITPEYLRKVGLADQGPSAQTGDEREDLINFQMKSALEKVSFLPFGKLIDQWRWDVYAGKIKPSDYVKSWWALRRRYQGVDAPIPRTEEDFDPGAKYHIAANVPYVRYFLARILQFQFHRALCKAAGHQGPLYQCSIYGNHEAGRRLNQMLALGASRPWPEALEVLTGQRQMDAGAMLEYFAPLRSWLAEKNQGQQCGW